MLVSLEFERIRLMSEQVSGPNLDSVDIVVLPGGKIPERKSHGAIGYDAYARAIVSQTEMDENDDRMRKTLFDFQTVPSNPWLQEHIIPVPDKSAADAGEFNWAYVLHPGEHALIGVGFVTALPSQMMIWLTPRSGLSMRRLTLTNAPGTIDPDYRGEAGALLVNESGDDFVLQHHTRIAQVIFCPVFLPELAIKETVDDLEKTQRAGGGFGSTGLLG